MFFSSKPNEIKNSFSEIILDFYKLKRPLASVSYANLDIACILKKYNPIVAISESKKNEPAPVTLALNEKIQYEFLPVSDYISDRDCKLLSNISDFQFNSNEAHCTQGLKLLLKELVEIS